jgi:hypothetical protein
MDKPLASPYSEKSPSPSPSHYHPSPFGEGHKGENRNVVGAEGRKEPPFKKIRVIELKQFFDSGKSFLKRRDGEGVEGGTGRELPPGLKDSTHGTYSQGGFVRSGRDDSSSCGTGSTLDTDLDVARPSSAMASYAHGEGEGVKCYIGEQRKSMPVLYQLDHESLDSSSQHSGQDSTNSSQVTYP